MEANVRLIAFNISIEKFLHSVLAAVTLSFKKAQTLRLVVISGYLAPTTIEKEYVLTSVVV